MFSVSSETNKRNHCQRTCPTPICAKQYSRCNYNKCVFFIFRNTNFLADKDSLKLFPRWEHLYCSYNGLCRVSDLVPIAYCSMIYWAVGRAVKRTICTVYVGTYSANKHPQWLPLHPSTKVKDCSAMWWKYEEDYKKEDWTRKAKTILNRLIKNRINIILVSCWKEHKLMGKTGSKKDEQRSGANYHEQMILECRDVKKM